ncbi:hypothetical protein OJAV_G00185090 [Oryzias javanicus]|uniref:Ig-like domain-containing protein n=1 Tax=Oryzias javanicus TaxID=123683 RepID=A0A3S2PH20_ORYJA|nr:hypothetical protein OJAV_G00185090 [Oryzias javanicus]
MWTLGSVLFSVLVGSSVSGSSDLIISAEPGQNITLPCGDPNINEVFLLEWIRTDLKKDEYVFLYRDNHTYPDDQHESFKNRVFLKNNQMKDEDLSVVLKNLKTEDSGRYECRVVKEDDPQRELKLISSIHLQVSPPDLNITAKPGENVTLPCGDAKINKDSVLEWTRTDLQKDKDVFFRMNNSAVSEGRPESFKNRVILKKNQVKDGDLSVVLKNLKIEDSGTYECKDMKRRSRRSADQRPPIAIINLLVSPGEKEGQHKGGGGDGGSRANINMESSSNHKQHSNRASAFQHGRLIAKQLF